jgi:hypothetical protein
MGARRVFAAVVFLGLNVIGRQRRRGKSFILTIFASKLLIPEMLWGIAGANSLPLRFLRKMGRGEGGVGVPPPAAV